MPAIELFTTNAHPSPRLRDEDIDMFGLTHPGLVRAENQDHFLAAIIRPVVVIHGTSLPQHDELPLQGERIAGLVLVADGVGGAAHGQEAAQLATEAVMRYVTSSLRCYHTIGTKDEEVFLDALRKGALEAHEFVRAEALRRTGSATMATTLTLGISVWPWLYVLQVGDSRCYYYHNGVVHQVTRDQTVAQSLVDQGLMAAERAEHSPFKHMLASAIGAEEALPVVTRLRIDRKGSVLLFCTDGLTKHVTDAEIAEGIATHPSSEAACRALLDLALSRGGSDNVTVVAVRRRVK